MTSKGKYSEIKVSEQDRKEGEYKRHLGGGAEHWETRGLFQLDFLKSVGLTNSSTLLDIGCGPIRAGKHLIKFLDAGNYYGTDYNEDFLSVARDIVNEDNLSDKNPNFVRQSDFQFGEIERSFNYIIAFSVLNHCSHTQRDAFFKNVPSVMDTDTRLFISHGHWFNDLVLDELPLVLHARIPKLDIDIHQYGWLPGETIFPFLEIRLTSNA